MVESPSRSLFKKAGFVFTIALSLWAITDENISVGKALQQHEPSLRVFRSLLEVNLLLFCTAAALFVWSKTIGQSTIEALLFQPLKLSGAYPENADRHVYAMTEVNDDEVLQEDDALDADYASDGEVDRQEDLDEKLYIPNAASVADAALNMLFTILVVLFLFTLSSISTAKHSVEEVASNTNSSGLWDLFSRVTAPVFPLLLFLYFLLRAIFPWRRKRSFWAVVFMTMSAPWHPVDFRDGFIGDIITSSVRPMQDIAFTVFYILSGLRGWWSREYRDGNFIDSADASVPAMERSWLLHTVVLPMCMVSPLWWRFLQNLRQSYDSKQRWPYLGNALKYCFAAQIAMFGVFNPDQKKSVLWLTSFVGATLYQLWWDIFMDWCLLVRVDGRWKLRSTRLYTKTSVYWIICGANLVLRFCWTLSFVPPRYLNASGVLKESFSGDVKKILGPFIASAEIVRRALWGLLRFEWEATKRYSDRKSSFDESQDGLRNEIDLTPMKIKQDEYSKSSNAFSVSHSWKMSSMNEVQIIGELCVYATAFWLIGTLAAAHRGTL